MPTIPKRPSPIKITDSFYQTTRWKDTRRMYFNNPVNVLCKHCQRLGRKTVAFILDHVLPRRLFPELEWEVSNFQGLCRACDNAKRQIERWITSRQDAIVKLQAYRISAEMYPNMGGGGVV